jgi:hypothetical protein
MVLANEWRQAGPHATFSNQQWYGYLLEMEMYTKLL